MDAKTPLDQKSTVDEIRQRFDADVERFSNLYTGQQATIDAPLVMELITQAAIDTTPQASRVLDIGCGAGNNTLRLLQHKANLDCDLLDLSAPMLQRAYERIQPLTSGAVRRFQADIRVAELPNGRYDIIIAAAVLHHLRDEADWRATFERIFELTAPGGSLWVSDLVSQDHAALQAMMWSRYGEYLESQGGVEYRRTVFDYIDKEDSPRSLTFQLDLLREVGYTQIDVLHKNACFAAFGATKNPVG